ncbi:MAG: putative 4-hydroxybenzoate polyprenyltransferase [Candidatus Thermoplasmatota archaeon]|nr:putative 4-hydroxybenzoate polyprenyltransferase [Candidatus Thermoplasmatota archaeon]MCL5794612.1 putative 4-hydroxybenzoate polyprenyltransferase [Candidatus Thermoplasmatota archaeon]
MEKVWPLISLRKFLEYVKFEHTVFDLPFVWSGAVIASQGEYNLLSFLIITVAAVSARATAMSVNRILGKKYDVINPRKKTWPLVTGVIKGSTAVQLTIVFAVIFEVSAYLLNRLVFLLSPIVLLLFLTDPLLKKYTPWRHLYMGFTIGVGVLGGYLAIMPVIPTSPEIYLVFLASSLWIGGFDMIYVIPDIEFDRINGLKTVMTRYGVKKGLAISAVVHAVTALAFLVLALYIRSIWYYLMLVPIIGLILFQHVIVKPGDERSIRMSFLGANAFIGFLFLIALILYYL